MVIAYDISKKKEELRNLIRNSDIIPTSVRGVLTETDLFSGDDTQTEFILAGVGVKNIRQVVVSGVTMRYGEDFEVIEDDQAITTIKFITPPTSGTDNIAITYDYGLSDKIFDDFPQDFLTIKTFPRIGFDIINDNTNPISLGGSGFQSSVLIQINCYSEHKSEVEEFITKLRQLIYDNKDKLYYWNYLQIDSVGPLIPSEVKGGKVFQRNIDIRADFEFEGVDC